MKEKKHMGLSKFLGAWKSRSSGGWPKTVRPIKSWFSPIKNDVGFNEIMCSFFLYNPIFKRIKARKNVKFKWHGHGFFSGSISMLNYVYRNPVFFSFNIFIFNYIVKLIIYKSIELSNYHFWISHHFNFKLMELMIIIHSSLGHTRLFFIYSYNF